MLAKTVMGAVEKLCWLAHRMWWIPIWNRSYLLTCPYGWMMRFRWAQRIEWKDGTEVDDVTVAYPLVVGFADSDGNIIKAHMKLTYEDAMQTILEDEAPEGFVVVESQLDLGSDRWESYHRVILERLKDGSFFAADYCRGLTEYQENMFFGYGYSASELHKGAPEGAMVQFDRVWPKQIVTTVYVKSPDEVRPPERI